MKKRFDPSPQPGLSPDDFKKICVNGFGDPYNSYPHSMAWFDGKLYVGTTRANFCLRKTALGPTNIDIWPVECPDQWYDLRDHMCAQIWRYDPENGTWEYVFRSPIIEGKKGELIPREMGFRGITVFKGKSDEKPALYIGPYSPRKSHGPHIIRSVDGKNFEIVSKPGIIGLPITTIRSLVSFKGKLFTAPAGRAKGNPNTSGEIVILASDDPAKGKWFRVNKQRLGGLDNQSIFELAPLGDYLYAGTLNNNGFELWRTDAEGDPPYSWEKVLEKGAYRGSLNQAAVSLIEFKGYLYIGTGIQHGGFDIVNNIGPASPEVIRINTDGNWDLIVGNERETSQGYKQPLSGFVAGFNNFFNGYFWRMEVHNGWLYLGTFKWSNMLRYIDKKNMIPLVRRLINSLGIENIVQNLSGAELYRTYDGENWLPVTVNGFDNYYNYGIRTMASSPLGLFVGVVNPFAPKVAVKKDKKWVYQDNKRGGLEIWLGNHKSKDIPLK